MIGLPMRSCKAETFFNFSKVFKEGETFDCKMYEEARKRSFKSILFTLWGGMFIAIEKYHNF